MRVVIGIVGAFHHFDLARELAERNLLQQIYSTFPWARLKREGLDHSFVSPFPWLTTPHMLLRRYGLKSEPFDNWLDLWERRTLDRYVLTRTRNQPATDALIGLSSSLRDSAKELQARGTRFFCDRASTHALYQKRVVDEEFARWGVAPYIHPEPILRREVENYEMADAITVPSHACRRSFLEYGVPAEKIHVIPYGVRLDKFSKVADPPHDSFEVLFVGALSLRKGIPYLLQAFAALKHPNKRLTIIGSPDDRVAQVVARLPTENVRFLGALPQSELVAHMSRSHVLVLPSVEEGLALVQGQAMACGCPILATTATGAEDIFTHGIEGSIVEPRRVDLLTQHLEQLAGDRELRDRMGSAALERVKSLGGWHDYGSKWESLLKSVTGKT
jgi:glycosyltransferase involved in cell wall biosynthesis